MVGTLSGTPGENKLFAGNIQHCIHNWRELTSDAHVLDITQGYKLEFSSKPCQIKEPSPINFSQSECIVVEAEIVKLLRKGVIKPSAEEPEQFVSNIFIRPKKEPGTFRVILNLKPLNKFIVYHHFKMDSIHTCTSLMHKDCYMASIDLKDAYYAIPIAPEDQKFLKFRWLANLYQFTAMPMGLTSAPRIFSKLCKPALAHLRLEGHILSMYIDDLYIQADSAIQCAHTVQVTLQKFQDLGFFANIQKSQLQPTKSLHHLGFILDSGKMCIGLPADKEANIKQVCTSLLNLTASVKIRHIAHALGVLVSYTKGVLYGELHTRALEHEKNLALRESKGNFETRMTLRSPAIFQDLLWWIDNCKMPKPISHGNPDIGLQTDASLEGWGAVLCTQPVQQTGGRWSLGEKRTHINGLELQAAFFGLQTFRAQIRDKHVLLQMDNSTAVAYMNHMGGAQSQVCNQLARDIWDWCIGENIWVTATFLPGIQNTLADTESRQFNDRTEWSLCQDVFNTICKHFDNSEPDIDMFASRLNTKLPKFCSWRPDPQAVAINAFTIAWDFNLLYLFPPFSILQQVLQKLRRERAEAILVAPQWPTQAWFSILLQLAISEPLPLPRRKEILYLPHQPTQKHPLWKDLRLMAWRISGKRS